jgi:hypothetical protein
VAGKTVHLERLGPGEDRYGRFLVDHVCRSWLGLVSEPS